MTEAQQVARGIVRALNEELHDAVLPARIDRYLVDVIARAIAAAIDAERERSALAHTFLDALCRIDTKEAYWPMNRLANTLGLYIDDLGEMAAWRAIAEAIRDRARTPAARGGG